MGRERARAEPSRHVGGEVEVLDGRGHAVQRRQLCAVDDRALGVLRGRAGLVRGDEDEGADVMVEPIDALEVVVDELDG